MATTRPLRLFRNYTFDETNIANYDQTDEGFDTLARTGRLPAVTFIEPDYIEAPPGNDDHAPADVMDGQRLVAQITSALLASPQWEKTRFIITYDEHGGFYDHAPPAEEMTAGDGTVTRVPRLSLGDPRLGVRVPAFVISPFGKVNGTKTVFDHTTIPPTILRRFCAGRVPVMSPRVSQMADLGTLLTRETPRPAEDFEVLAREMTQIAARPLEPLAPIKPPKSDNLDDFHNLIAFASAMTGHGPGG